MSDMKPNTLCKHCRQWLLSSIKFPCRACDNEGRSPHPYPGEKIKNYYKRHPKLDPIINIKLVEEKKKEMGL